MAVVAAFFHHDGLYPAEVASKEFEQGNFVGGHHDGVGGRRFPCTGRRMG